MEAEENQRALYRADYSDTLTTSAHIAMCLKHMGQFAEANDKYMRLLSVIK